MLLGAQGPGDPDDGRPCAHAVKARERRVGLPAERALYEQRENGQILIDTEGVVVGQINGLSVIETLDGDYGAPTRITVRTAPGLAGIVNIERESELSGPIHDKGIYTLEGFLTGRFAMEIASGSDGEHELRAGVRWSRWRQRFQR